MAKAVNCETPLDGEPCGKCASCRMIDDGTATDVLELDAASNNGVENVRDIRDEVVYTPAALKRRVYIIDEVHMLSIAAFNALLKTLEEPPEHVVFILATTEPQKIPATIISRCQRFDFRRIENREIVDCLTMIASAENIGLDPDAAMLIARLAQGGMRDAISMLELCSGDGARVTEEVVRVVAGVAGRGLLAKAVAAISEHDIEGIFNTVNVLYSSSLDIAVFWAGLVAFYRDMLVINSTKNPRTYLELTTSEYEETATLAKRFSREALTRQSGLADDALVRMSRANSSKRLIAELTLIRMSDARLSDDASSLAERIAALEEAVAGGSTITETKPAVKKRLDNELEPSQTATIIEQNADKDKPPPRPINKNIKTNLSEQYLRWADAVEKFSQIRGCESTAGFLGLAEAFRESDGFIIAAPPSTLSFIDTNEIKTKLASILSSLEGHRIEFEKIKIISAAKTLQERRLIDEITN